MTHSLKSPETLVHSDAIAQALIAALQEISLTSNETNIWPNYNISPTQISLK